MRRRLMAALSAGWGRQRRVKRSQTPTRPLGENSTKPTKVRPNQNSQSVVQIENSSRKRM